MALLLKQLNPAISAYRDRRFQGSQEEFEEALRRSTCIYVGNLSFYTTEDQIYEVGMLLVAAVLGWSQGLWGSKAEVKLVLYVQCILLQPPGLLSCW